MCVEAAECEPLAQTVAVPDLREGDGEIWSRSCNGQREERRDHPANCVTWIQAEAYCAAQGKRLPTEAEWEWAASGGDEERRYPWGGQRPSPGRLNACGFECAERLRRLGRPRPPLHFGEDGHEDTAPVGSFPDGAGRWGHLDLAGNVWEFTSSLYADDPSVRVIRGGGWAQSRSEMVQSGYRGGYLTNARGSAVGFRCAATPGAPRLEPSLQTKEVLP
jgi:formylglycine-generating enzyme required for sulfatase activity